MKHLDRRPEEISNLLDNRLHWINTPLDVSPYSRVGIWREIEVEQSRFSTDLRLRGQGQAITRANAYLPS